MPGKGEKTKSTHIGYLGELTIEQARAVASGYAHERRCGIDPIKKRQKAAKAEESATTLIISNYFEDFKNHRTESLKPFTNAQIQVYLRNAVAHIGGLRLDKFTQEDIREFVRQLAERGPSAHRSGMTSLRSFLLDATKLRLSSQARTCPKPNERDRRLTNDEVQPVLEGPPTSAT